MSDITAQREHARPEMSGPVLGMVLFVASEAMFFAAFFGGYFTIRANAPVWPPPDVPHLKIDIASILTVVLVASSVAVQLSLRATRDGRRRQALWWLGATIGLGVVFLGLQLYDYSQLGFGLKDGVFGTLFYVMTGIHMAHVIGGVAFLTLVFAQGSRLVAGNPGNAGLTPMVPSVRNWILARLVSGCPEPQLRALAH